MHWLLPSVTCTLTCSSVLFGVFLYLYVLDRTRYLLLWSVAWGLYALRYVCMLAYLMDGSKLQLILNQSLALWSAVLLAMGVGLFAGRHLKSSLLAGLAAGVNLWIIASIWAGLPFMAMSVPSFGLQGLIYIWTGSIFLRHFKTTTSREGAVAGWAFILWGVHKADYPFVRPLDWFAPWGYLLGAALALTVALAMVLIYFRIARERLSESEARFRRLYEHVPDVIYRMSLPEGRYDYVSPSSLAVTGFTPQEFYERPFLLRSVLHPECTNHFFDFFEQAVAKGERVHEYEYKILDKKGSERWLNSKDIVLSDENGAPVAVEGIVRDVTERKRYEQALSESERQLSTLMSNLPGMAYRCRNDRQWTMQFVSHGCFELTGHQPRELQDNKTIAYADLIHPEDREYVWDTVQAALAGERNFEVEYRIITAKGEQKYVWEKGVGIYDHGQLLFLEGLINDITGRKQAEEDRKQLHAQLFQAQKMESVGRLAGGVAHDLNNMLTPILGFGEMLRFDLDTGQKGLESIDEILKAGYKARDLVGKLLAFSRRQTLNVKPSDMNEVVTGLEMLLRRTIREDIELDIAPYTQPCPVMADTGQIEQVLINLAVNAADAMPDGGRLTVETARVELDEEYAAAHSQVVPGSYVMLAVSDTGLGMDAHTREHVFEPFFSTKGSQGTGLGLASVFGIVKQHGGHIWVYSEPGQGTIFKIYFPQAGAEHWEEEEEEGHPAVLRGTETVILTEDNRQVLHLAQSVLSRQGYTVFTAENGDQALQVFKTCETPVHLLLTDVVMPDMDGKELYARAAALSPDLKVLYMSGYTENVIAHHGVLDQGISFIQKPFSVSALCGKVREVLDAPLRQ